MQQNCGLLRIFWFVTRKDLDRVMGMEHPGWQEQDVERLQRTMEAVEQACAALEVPDVETRAAAEAALMSFRRSPQPIRACQFILDRSQMAIARFQAAATMQEAAIREWALLSAEEKDRLRTYCLHYVMARAEASEGYVQAKVLSVVAVLLKRGWLEYVATEKDVFFNEVQQAVVGRHGLAAQRSGMSLLEALISEFSLSTASPMALPAEFHDHCRASLELDYLQKFYAWALDASVMVAGKAVEGFGDSQETIILTSAVRLMYQILNWEFQGTIIRGAGGVIVFGKNRASAFSSSWSREHSSGRRSTEPYLGQLGAAWYDLLVSPERIEWILNLYAHIRQKGSAWLDSPPAVVARQLIVQLCSLNGNIFPADGGVTQEKHLQRLLGGIISWIDPPNLIINALMAGASESEMLDGCRALLAIATLGSPSSFDQLLKQAPRSTGTLSLLASLTCEVIRVNGIQQNEESQWVEEALDILFEIWTVLLQPADLSKRIPLPPSGVDAAAAVFHTYVEFELKVSETSAFDEGDPAEQTLAAIEARDERLSAVALVARAAPSVSVPLLALLISKCCSALHQCSRGEDPVLYLEQLHWLVIMSGHVLADSGEGETPMVPESILALSDPGAHPAVTLSCTIIELARQSLDATFRMNLLSPRLMEAVTWFFGRWVDTYLMPVDAGRGPNSTPSGHEGEQQVTAGTQFDGRNALNAAFGKEGGGMAVLEVLVRVALTALTAWPGEQTLQEHVCFQLLPALVRRRNICTQLLSLGAWQELASAFARQNQTLFSLGAPIQRALSESLCRSAAGMTNADAANQYVKELLVPMAVSVSMLSERKDLPAFAQQPDVIHQVSCLLERLRGAARAILPRSQKAIFEIGASVMKPFLVFLEIYKHQSSVVYLLLKYVVDWVDGQVAFLESKDTAMLFSFCVQLLGVYSVHNIGKVSISASGNLLSETQTEKYKDLRALLQLLTNLSSKDLVDFACDINGELENPDVAQVVYLGLNIITPLISLDLLKYPKLCRQYFTLIAHMLEVYPEKVAKLSSEGFNQIVSTLDFGLRHQDVEVVNMTLTALNAIAFFHYQAVCRGQEGLGLHAEASQATGGDGVLAHFLRSLMQFLLFEDYSNELVEPAADALLPLILCSPALYQKLIQELLEGQQNLGTQSRLAAAFHLLSNGNQITSSVERSNRRKFRENLYVFLNDVRGFLRTR